MKTTKRIINILGSILVVLGVLLYCSPIPIPTICSVRVARFKNCTGDTLFIGASHYNNVDSIDVQLFPAYNILFNSNLATNDISLWKDRIKDEEYGRIYIEAAKDGFIYPDSACIIDADYLFSNNDTCYFFLIKWENAKNNSWDEIRIKKLFHRWIVTRDKEGKFDRNIKIGYQ